MANRLKKRCQRILATLLVVSVLALGSVFTAIGLLSSQVQVEAAPHESRTVQKAVVNWDAEILTLTGTQVLTPSDYSSSLFVLQPVTAVTYTIDTADAKLGDMIMLIGDVATNTIIVDTGAVITGTNQTIGDRDVFFAIFNGAEWSQISGADNQ